MSDGPHRSLPMRPAWRRVAERGDKRAYTTAEISQALGSAVEQDCRNDMSPEFLRRVRCLIDEPSLFDDVAERLAALGANAGSGLGRAVLDNAALLSTSNLGGGALVHEALKAA